MYTGTRSEFNVSASYAVLKGLAEDGGLFIPSELPKLDARYLAQTDYKATARAVLRLFLDDYTDEEITAAVDAAYFADNFPDGEIAVKSFGGISFLELFHGPTLAFKDMALTILPHLMNGAKRKNGVSAATRVLVATSGDTGGAALSSFLNAENTSTTVIYPEGGVSEIQEKQMLFYTNAHTHAYAFKGNFDDCQTLVKSIFRAYKGGDVLSSANSINIGRLIPQIVYYVNAYARLVSSGVIKQGEEITASVPTGNFGDILAGYIAKRIGVPIADFICASNANDVLFDFFSTGVYDRKRVFHKTCSPAMDILVSSNLERLLRFVLPSQRVAELERDLDEKGKFSVGSDVMSALKGFVPHRADDVCTKKAIGRAFDKYGYLIDPHTAVAFDAAEKFSSERHILVVSTASPFKFPSTVCDALGLVCEGGEFEKIARIEDKTSVRAPIGITKLLSSDKRAETISAQRLIEMTGGSGL